MEVLLTEFVIFIRGHNVALGQSTYNFIKTNRKNKVRVYECCIHPKNNTCYLFILLHVVKRVFDSHATR